MNQLLSYLRAVLCVLMLAAGLREANAQCANITAAFSVNATGCGIPRNYTFTNTSTGVSSSVASYIWRQGSTVLDTFTGTSTTPTVTINNPGTDTVWLVAIDTNGCRDSVMQTLVTTTNANTIYDPSTNTFNYSPVWQNCILFLTAPDSFVIDVLASGTLTNYRMIWGDGGADSGNSLPNGNTISHTYQSLGTYTVRIVSQNGSCYDTITGTVINERIPTAGIIGPPAGGNVGCAPHTVRFINNSSNVSNATQFRWNMGDGTQYILGSSTANDTLFHTYTAGLCNGLVSVTAFNACGSSTATWTPIFVNDEDDASFTVNTANCDPSLPFTFTNTSTNNYCTPSTRLFYWDFGDGTTAGWLNNTLPQNHTFPQAGSYTVRLIDSNLCGTDTFEFQAIINFTPNPGFIYSVDNGCPPLEVSVIDTSAGVQNIRLWTYGNGQTSGDSIDTVTYLTPGTYNLQLTVSNICGTVSRSVPINVWSPPDALLSTIPDGCSPHQVGFTNNSTFFHDSTVSFFWDFGDGTNSTDRDPPDKIYSTPGTYSVRLYVIDTCGTDSITRTFTVHPKPEAGFLSDTVCQGANTSFTDTSSVSSGSITGWTWRFDNPSQGNSSVQNPSFSFNAADTFPVQLIVSTNRGCLDTVENPAVVWANPITSWAVAPNDSVCIGTGQTFDGTASAGSGTVASYFWDFANGSTASQEDTALTYPLAGNYSVKFRVINTLGCADSSIGTITVLPLPQVSFTADTACVGQLTTFTDLSTVSLGTIGTREWDLDNNGAFDSAGINTSFIYNSVGSRYVRLRVTTLFGCGFLDSNLISVNPLPVPAISVDSSTICMGQPITVSNTTTGAVSYTYDFGDGTQVTVANTNPVQHTYTDSGVYTIRMYASSDRSCIDSTTATVTVRPTPLAQFTVNQQIACAPFNFVFTNGSLRSSVYAWYSNGNFASTAEHRPDTLISLDSQVVRITLIANNTFSCPADTAELFIGTSRNPIASFVTNPDSGCGPLNVAFGNTSQFASSFTWDFGNGQSSSASDTSMTFTAAAVNDSTYTIRLIAFNWQGCPDTTEAPIVVHPNPTVSFTQSNTDSCGPLTVSFNNTSVHNAGGTQADMNFVWDFGNGLTTTVVDTIVQYFASQTIDSIYTVQLIGQSRYGCLDTFTSTVTVYPNPVAQFTVSQADSCGPFGVQFTNLSIPNNGGGIGIMSFNWDLGNGQTSTAQNPFTSYPASLIQDSVFAIQLIARSEHGCPDTAVSSVRSYPKPNAFYTQSDTSGCGPLDITFTNLSVPYDTGTINNMTFAWDFGNGITSTAQDTTVRFISAPANDTVYTVRMIAYSEHGCADTFTSTVRVHPGPVAQFTVNQAIACAPFNFVFTNTSFNSNNFYWMVDGVVTSNQTTRPDTLISQDSSTALIGLIAETSFGCPNDTTEMLIGTSRNPIAAFVTNPDSGCGPLNVAFGNTSQFASSFTWNFGNGQSSSASDTSMTFTAAAVNDSTYTIQLIAYNWQGCPDTTEAPIVVHPNPSVSFTQSNTDSCGPLTVSFSNTSVHNAGGNQGDMSFVWDFGNGVNSTAADTSVAYFASQLNDTSYAVRLIGYSRYGCPDTAFSTVVVYPNPVAQFTVSQADSCGPFGVQFSNQSVPNNGGSIAIMSFDWDLGNGQTSTVQNPFSSYPASLIQDSLYTIRLIAYSEHGCPDTAERTVRAYPKPTATYTQSDTSGCGPLTVDFTNTSLPYDTSSLADMTFEWDFGNGQSSTNPNNTVVYTAAALNDTVYSVRLIAYSEHGCADTTFSTVRVHPKPSVSLTKDDSTGCDPVPVNFTASGVNVSIFHWDFRDGTTTTVQNPSHDFRAVPFYDTTYRVSLVGESAFGCPSDTLFTNVTVLGNPFADFTVVPDSVCASTTSQMINNSLGAVNYLWDFGNGDTSSAVSPQAFYTLNPSADTSYYIRLIATNTFGCSDTADGYVVVSPSPTAQFILDIDSGCSPLQVQFTDQSRFAFRHNWYFSNGFSDTAQNPSATFTNSSITDSVFTATLIVTNAGGCTDTAARQIRIYPFPTADFVASPAAGCGDLSITFNNQSTPNDTGSLADMSFSWDLGNGLTSTATNPNSLYPRSSFQDSLFQVTLIGISEHGCRDTISRNVRTYPRPVASFTQSDTSGCGPLVVSFNNTSIPNDTGNIGIMNFVWNFGNGLISYDQNDTVTFYPALSQDTVYTIRLIALSEHGCRDTTYSTVRVHPDPTVAFTLNPSSGCGPLSVAFTSTTQNASSYFWNFGNGDTSTAQNPVAIFQNRPDFDTTYTISFSAFSQYACPSDTVTRSVTVRPDPVAAFTQNRDSICGTSTLTFSNSSTGANSYTWNFGDGSTSSQANPQHSFAMNPTNDTTYTVRLIANNFFGCRDTVFGSVTIYPFPTAVITTNVDNGCTPLAVNFGHSSLLSTSYSWTFGNGSTSTSETPSSNFTNATLYDTIYNVRLRVESVHGCADSVIAPIRVYPLPTASFTTLPSNGCGDLAVNFSNQSSPNDTGSINIMSFNWDLGNGQTSTAQNPSANYVRSLIQDSVYTIQLIATSEHGCLDTTARNVRVFPKPDAVFTQSDSSGCGPLTVQFNNVSVPFDTGSIADMSFMWDFGNGQGSTAQSPSMTFYPSLIQDTVYTIRLISLSEHGCRDTAYSTVRVHPDPNLAYTQDQTSGCQPLVVNFTSNVLNVATYYWNFGDGTTSSLANPDHVFMGRPDFDTTYTVRFWAQSPRGCWSDTLSSTVIVRHYPVASFIKSTDSICGTTNIFFTNQTTGANSYSWDFGDGSTSSQANPQHSFAMNPTNDTTYTVRLIANNFFGCRDTVFGSVTIYPFPTAVVTTNVNNGCTPLAVNFGHSSLLSTSYSWSFGNGSSSTSETPSSNFTNPTLYDTIYNVRLRVESVHGCADSVIAPIRVYPLPTASFATLPSNGCGDLAVNFSNQSSPNDTGSINIMSFTWDLGNGQTSTAQNPSANYVRSLIQDSVYTIQLIASSEHGCLDTTARNVRVFPKPDAVFTQSDTSGCGPLTVQFNNLSVPFDTGSIADMTFMWDFGNGQGSTAQSPSMTFYPSLIQDTVYTVRLISVSEHGCRDTAYSTVRVHPDPLIAYSQSPNSGCGPLDVQFSSTVLNVGTYFWDFGDGSTSSLANPSHSFGNQPFIDTSYSVRMWAQSPRGCWSDTLSSVVIVRPDPIANFNSNLDSLCGGGQVQFSNVSQLGYTYEWSFGDGSTGTTLVNPQHTFNQIPFTDTAYAVRLIATSIYGCKDTLVRPLTIFPLPQAQLTFTPDSGCSPLNVFLGNTSTIAQSHFWELGNGDTMTADTFSYVFDNALGIDRIYQVIVTASTVHGCIDKDTAEIRVHPLPRPNFIFSKTGVCDTSEYNFTNLTAGAVSYTWDFGDGSGSLASNPSHIYPTAVSSDSIFTAKLIATSNRGCVDSISKTVTVTPIMLARATTNGAMGCPPLAVDFINNSTNATNYYWEFDDGFVSVAANPSHTFINPDPTNHVYNVRLVVSNAFGCADTAIVPVTVFPNVDASFIFTKSSRCDIGEYNFTNLSVGGASYAWDFGDGSTSTQMNPVHVFPTSQTQDTTFTVRLIVQSAANCYDTFVQPVRVNPVVRAEFTIDNNEACSFMLAQFTNLSVNGRFYVWDFGDGTGSAQFSPSHPYGQVGSYIPSLIVYDQNGCSDTFTLANPVNIYETPIANFIATPSSLRLPLNTFSFVDLSVASGALNYR